MPQTIGEVINNLALKAGILADNPDLKSLLASEQLANVQVPDALIADIDKGLLNIDAAKNNHPDIKKKYFADAYDGMDKQLLALVANDTFDENDLAEIKAESSTSKKQALIVSKLKAAKKADKGANNDEWNKKIADANEAARLAKEEVVKVKTEYEGKIKGIHLDSALNNALGEYKTIFDDLPAGAKKASLRAIIEQGLQDKNAKLEVDEHGNMRIVGIDGSNVFGSNHVQLTVKSFLDQTIAPTLKVNGGPAPAAPHNPPNIPAPTGATGNEAGNALVKSLNDQAIAALSAPATSLM